MDLIALQMFVYTNQYKENKVFTKNLYVFTRYIIIVKIMYCKRNIAKMSEFFYQLGAQIIYFNIFITFLYMFRALLCSSSGAQLY